MSAPVKITEWVSLADKSGEFKRQVSSFRDHISREPGAKYPPEKDRYHLYVSYACPWAHRTLIARQLKGSTSSSPTRSSTGTSARSSWALVTSLEPGSTLTRDEMKPGLMADGEMVAHTDTAGLAHLRGERRTGDANHWTVDDDWRRGPGKPFFEL
ncbi:hypothetical protein NLG97_g596 [Lecanicillium saksenae]|uniref:Uncharacterized protein n=1 Tax=Lecanicillium saksenae TaxID=468837 RepID=A0ACC1R622_9HYPO|nr:hypothetical protein NLG97_g596 [Lecanicillium saksenae]